MPLQRISCFYTLHFAQRRAIKNVRNCRRLLQVTYHVDEETSVGAFVGNIITDARLVDVYPSADVSSLRFRFLRRRVTGFSLDPVTGVLTTSGRLDREALCGPTASSSASSASLAAGGSCLLRIDVAIQPMQFFRIVRVLVYVHDINDNAPQSVYHCNYPTRLLCLSTLFTRDMLLILSVTALTDRKTQAYMNDWLQPPNCLRRLSDQSFVL